MKSKRSNKIRSAKQRTITRSQLSRLSICNSKKLPLSVNDGGLRKEWVGIGWIETGEPHGDEVLVIE